MSYFGLVRCCCVLFWALICVVFGCSLLYLSLFAAVVLGLLAGLCCNLVIS